MTVDAPCDDVCIRICYNDFVTWLSIPLLRYTKYPFPLSQGKALRARTGLSRRQRQELRDPLHHPRVRFRGVRPGDEARRVRNHGRPLAPSDRHVSEMPSVAEGGVERVRR